MPFAITKPCLTPADLQRVDPRILAYLQGSWRLKEYYKGNTVLIPDYVPFNYFEDLDKGGDKSEYEKQLSVWMGWAGRSNGKDIDGLFDAEAQMTISVNGPDAADINKPTNVNFEFLKSGGADMQLFYQDQLMTDWTQPVIADFGWLIGKRTMTIKNGYQTRSLPSK